MLGSWVHYHPVSHVPSADKLWWMRTPVLHTSEQWESGSNDLIVISMSDLLNDVAKGLAATQLHHLPTIDLCSAVAWTCCGQIPAAPGSKGILGAIFQLLEKFEIPFLLESIWLVTQVRA